MLRCANGRGRDPIPWLRLDEVGMDRLEAGKLVPPRRLEVIDERPEQGAHHALAVLALRNARELAGADKAREALDVLDAEVPPARRGLLDCLLVVHPDPLDQTRTRL